jgi:hypothetical protein
VGQEQVARIKHFIEHSLADSNTKVNQKRKGRGRGREREREKKGER